MTLVHLMNIMTAEDLESPSLHSSLTTHFESTLLPIFQQHGRRIAAVSPSDDRKNEASDKMMMMANAESHLGLLKAGLRVDGGGGAGGSDDDAMEEAAERKAEDDVVEKSTDQLTPSLRVVEQLLTLFSSSKVQEMEESFAEDVAFPTVNTAPNFKQTFD